MVPLPPADRGATPFRLSAPSSPNVAFSLLPYLSPPLPPPSPRAARRLERGPPLPLFRSAASLSPSHPSRFLLSRVELKGFGARPQRVGRTCPLLSREKGRRRGFAPAKCESASRTRKVREAKKGGRKTIARRRAKGRKKIST